MTESFNTSGQIRSEVIYVPWKIRKSLGYLAQAQGTTREALAETILGEWLASNHPKIGEYLDKRVKEEKEFQQSITTIPLAMPRLKPTSNAPTNPRAGEKAVNIDEVVP